MSMKAACWYSNAETQGYYGRMLHSDGPNSEASIRCYLRKHVVLCGECLLASIVNSREKVNSRLCLGGLYRVSWQEYGRLLSFSTFERNAWVAAARLHFPHSG